MNACKTVAGTISNKGRGPGPVTDSHIVGQQVYKWLATRQARWERLLAQLGVTRAQVEAAVAQWQDARDNCEQVLRWLRDAERRMVDADPRGELAEKRALLQKAKVCCYRSDLTLTYA